MTTGIAEGTNLWATWCAPCKAELPFLEGAHRDNPDVVVVGISIGDSSEAIARFLAAVGVSYPQYLDAQSRVSSALGVTNLPTTFAVDRSGTRTVVRGALDAGDIADLLAFARR